MSPRLLGPILLAAAVAVVAAVLLGLLNWYFRGESLIYESTLGEGHRSMAAQLDAEAEIILQQDGLARESYCLRAPSYQAFYNDDGCVLIRAALTPQWRQCTPHRANNGSCHAVEMRDDLLQQPRIHDLLFKRFADICFYRTMVNGYEQLSDSLDCLPPSPDATMFRRLEPMICVFALDANERVAAPAFAVRRGKQINDYWCQQWEALVHARESLTPHGCWLGGEPCDRTELTAPSAGP